MRPKEDDISAPGNISVFTFNSCQGRCVHRDTKKCCP
jgi:hypothetical protein